MTTARQFLDLVERARLRDFSTLSTEELLSEVPEAQFRTMVIATASLFKALRTEAMRRGIWDDLKTQKPST